MPRVVTVFADASFCPDTKAAGYAVWIKTDGQTIRHAGAFKTAVTTAGAAEVKALANGICLAVSRLDLKVGDMIVAQSDSTEALGVIRGGKRLARKWWPVYDRVRMALATRGVSLRLRHVKGHQGKDAGPRHAVNEWCDGAAKRVMRDERQALRTAAGNQPQRPAL